MFSPAQRMGMFFPILAGFLSAIAVCLVLSLAVRRWRRKMLHSPRRRGPDASDNTIFLNLMLSDFIQSLGEVTTVWWLADGVVTEGRLCAAQAVFRQVGANGVAFSSMAIAVHTFYVLVLRWNAPWYFSWLVVVAIWISTALIVSIPYIVHRKEEFYGSVGYWCDVTTSFRKEQLFTKYLWVWGSLCFMALIYTIIFTVMRGWIIVEDGVWYWYRNYPARVVEEDQPAQEAEEDQPAQEAEEDQPAQGTEQENETKAIARIFLFYPVPYFITIFPYSVTRWRFFYGYYVDYHATFFTTTLFALSGTFNAMLFFFTRPDLVIGSANSPPPTHLASTRTHSEPTISRTPSPNAIPLTDFTNNNIRESPRGLESDFDGDPSDRTGEHSPRNPLADTQIRDREPSSSSSMFGTPPRRGHNSTLPTEGTSNNRYTSPRRASNLEDYSPYRTG